VLEEISRERDPITWAMTQSNLGNALRAFGERESGTERLEQAVVAYQAALEVFESSGPNRYADMTRHNLSAAARLLENRRRRRDR
jgi:hypothetical protein